MEDQHERNDDASERPRDLPGGLKPARAQKPVVLTVASGSGNQAAMSNTTPELQPRLRFPHGGPEAFGPGKAELLRHIAATGSIRTAAAELKMSYNRAWLLVQAMNHLFSGPVVESVRGGKAAGGAVLTALGENVLSRYTRMEEACRKATAADWQALQRLLR